MDSFEALGILPDFIEKLKERSIVNPTAIQNLVIPSLIAKKNILFRSATGTGKTFAYLLPALQEIYLEKTSHGGTEAQRGVLVLICAPTLELCSQIKAEIDFLSKSFADKKCSSMLLIGSVNLEKQIEKLKKRNRLS